MGLSHSSHTMNNESIAWCREELVVANEQLEAARDTVEKDYNDVLTKICIEEKALDDRLEELSKKMDATTEKYGDIHASGDDILEINAGGKIIVTERSILTQPRTIGTRLYALFSGRYDKVLQRDVNGLIFLDVNSECFQAIMTYLNELIVCEKDKYPESPCVDDEYVHILCQHIEMFGLWGKVIVPRVQPPANSYIIPCEGDVSNTFVRWLRNQVGWSGYFSLRYRGTRDGLTPKAFDKRCDEKRLLMFILRTDEKYFEHRYDQVYCNYFKTNIIFGICSDSQKQLLYKLLGEFESDSSDRSTLELLAKLPGCYTSTTRNVYVCSDRDRFNSSFSIHELELFAVSLSSSTLSTDSVATEPPPVARAPVTRFLSEINDAINAKQDCLTPTELKVRTLEVTFREEQRFIDTFGIGDSKDAITLNVRGTMMTTKRSTLRILEDSVLAQQFDDSKWTEQGYKGLRVKRWNVDDVYAWVNKIEGIQEDIGTIFKTNDITGCELLALSIDGLKMLGIERAGTVCLLQKEIEQLVKASNDVVSLIDQCPYCFGKIIDFLRLKQLHAQGLAKEEPALPDIPKSQRARFEKVVNFYFPGDSAKLILGA
jgi:hypothetical protein